MVLLGFVERPCGAFQLGLINIIFPGMCWDVMLDFMLDLTCWELEEKMLKISNLSSENLAFIGFINSATFSKFVRDFFECSKGKLGFIKFLLQQFFCCN